jgi:hypothetical protein
MLNKEEKELLKKVARLLWDLGEIDSENDIAENILVLCNTVTTFEELGDLVISIVDRAEDE